MPISGELAYRGRYTGLLANQLKKSNGRLSILDMVVEANMQMQSTHGTQQTPKIMSTLMRHLILPGKIIKHEISDRLVGLSDHYEFSLLVFKP